MYRGGATAYSSTLASTMTTSSAALNETARELLVFEALGQPQRLREPDPRGSERTRAGVRPRFFLAIAEAGANRLVDGIL